MVRLLFVDDNEHYRELTRLQLTRLAPYVEVREASKATEALNMLKNEQFDCILSDYQMPDIDGLEFLQKIRSSGIDTPFIFLTGRGNEKIAVDAFRSGADDYWVKEGGSADYIRLLHSIRRIVEFNRHEDRRKELEAETSSQREILAAISEFDEEILHLRPEDIVERSLDFISNRLKLPFVSLALLDSKRGGFMLLGILNGANGFTPGSFLPASQTALFEAIQDSRPLYRPDLKALKHPYEIDEQMVASGYNSDVLVPLRAENECLGVLSCATEEEDGIDERRLNVLALLAPRLAQALKNAMLYDELRSSHDRNQAILEALPDLMFRINREGVFLDCHSPRRHPLSGKQGDFTGKKLREVFPAEIADTYQQQTIVALKTRTTTAFEFHLDFSNRTRRHFDTRIAVCGKDQVLIILRDVTERKRVEQALALAKERYDLAASAGRVGIWDWNIVTNDVYIDNKLKAFAGYLEREIESSMEGWESMIHTGDLRKMRSAMELCRNGASNRLEIELRMPHRDGRELWFFVNGVVLNDADGRPRRLMGTCTDITEIKLAQYAIIANEEWI